MSFHYDLHATRGQPFSHTVTVAVDDATPYDLTGYSAVLNVFDDVYTQTPRASVPASIDGPKGTLALHLDAATVAGLNEASIYRLDITSPEGETVPMYVGALLVAERA